jgi:hypothetical protein
MLTTKELSAVRVPSLTFRVPGVLLPLGVYWNVVLAS